MRLLGNLEVSFDPSIALVANDEVDITVGLGIFSTDAVAVGAGSVPDPAAEPEYPWLLWQVMNLYTPFSTSGVAVAQMAYGSASKIWKFDSRVMRKVKPGESLTWVVQYVDILGTPAVRYRMQQNRVLIALP